MLKDFLRKNKFLCLLLGFSFLFMIWRTIDPNYWNWYTNSIQKIDSYKYLDLLFWLAISYLPSFAIYLLVIYLPRVNDLRKIMPFIVSQASTLVGDAQAIIDSMNKELELVTQIPATRSDVEMLCKELSPSAQAPLLIDFNAKLYANWIGFFAYRMNRSLKTIQVIFRYVPYLDSEFLALISKIDDCHFFTILKFNQNFSNSNMSFLSHDLYNHYELTIKLKDYLDKNLKDLAWSEKHR